MAQDSKTRHYQKKEDRSAFGKLLHSEFLTPYKITQKRLAERSNIDPKIISDMVGGTFPYGETLYRHLYAIFKSLAELHVALTEEQVRKLLEAVDKNHLSQKRKDELITDLKKALIIRERYKTFRGLPLVGRDRDIAEIIALLEKDKVEDNGNKVTFLTLVGIPGVGKTELALQIGKVVQKRQIFPYVHVLFLESEDRDIGAVLGKITKKFADIGHEEKLLLILDNCEQIENAGNLVQALTELSFKYTSLTILATSRSELGDRSYPVQPLASPSSSQDFSLEDIQNCDAVELFLAGTNPSANAKETILQLTQDNAHYISAICRTVDGLPLGLLIASSWVEELEIEGVYNLLGTWELFEKHAASEQGEQRHYSLEQLIAWSYDLLQKDEQTLLRLLPVLCYAHSDFTCHLDELVGIYHYGDMPKRKMEIDAIVKKLVRHHLLTHRKNRIAFSHSTIRAYVENKSGQDREEIKKTKWQFITYYAKHVAHYFGIDDNLFSDFEKQGGTEELEEDLRIAEEIFNRKCEREGYLYRLEVNPHDAMAKQWVSLEAKPSQITERLLMQLGGRYTREQTTEEFRKNWEERVGGEKRKSLEKLAWERYILKLIMGSKDYLKEKYIDSASDWFDWHSEWVDLEYAAPEEPIYLELFPPKYFPDHRNPSMVRFLLLPIIEQRKSTVLKGMMKRLFQ